MQLNRDQFLAEGYLILRGVVPPDRLESLRAESEEMVELQRAIWAAERGVDDPPGGAWETSAQPRLQLSRTPELVDEQTAGFAEFWLHENTLGVSSELLAMPHAANTEMMMMCSPVSDRGPAAWHRDIHPFDTAPLQGYLDDIAENGPRYVQWNIPLYDDDVLWVVPGSHLRLNTEEEQRQLNQDPRVPLPAAVQTHLEAGDGVVYITPILHWGSNYSVRMRRTLHGGYCNFTAYRDLSFTQYLSAEARDTFAGWERQSGRCCDLTAAALRLALAGDATGYLAGLDALQPGIGDKGMWLLTAYLCKAACYIHVLQNPEVEGVAERLRASAEATHPTTLNWGAQFAERFTPAEAAALWQRFAVLDAALQSEEHHVAGFQGGPMPYHFNEMPRNLGLGSFVGGWSAGA
jgi:hypothetical protein